MNKRIHPRMALAQLRREASDFLKRANLGVLEDYEIAPTQGWMSIVLFPKAKPDEVLKIPYGPGSEQAFEKEAANLDRTKSIDIKSMDIVRLIEIGHEPNYIRMTRLGKPLSKLHLSDDEVHALGRAVGEFVVEFHQKTGGLIHHDIHYQNLTRQFPRRYGLLDFNNISSDDYEAAFLKLAVSKPNILMVASERILELTGRPLDPVRLRDMTLSFWERVDPSQLPLAVKNLQEFEASEVPGRGKSHRRASTLDFKR